MGGGSGCHLRLQRTDFLCLRRQYTELLAPKCRLQLRKVGKGLGAREARRKIEAGFDVPSAMSMILRLSATVPLPAAPNVFSQLSNTDKRVFFERSYSSRV
jgi:hypothetical protein